MQLEALADSDSTDEQNDVLKSLLDQEFPTSELVKSVFSQVQAEFTAWNAAYCRQVLTSFTTSFSWTQRTCWHPCFRPPNLASSTGTSSSSSDPRPRGQDASGPLFVSLEVYSPDGGVVETSLLKLDVIHLPSPLEPHPQYDSCSPLHRNVFKGDDSDDMGFIPYADDPTFDQSGHQRHYGSFSWNRVFDPDLEVIVLEAVYRLRTQHALTYDEIEDSDALPLRIRSQPGRPGVLSIFRRRDRLMWSGNTIPESYNFPRPTSSEVSRFRDCLGILNSLFCPNLGCIEPFCNVHVELHPMPLRSQRSLTRAAGEVADPCRNHCFISKHTGKTNPSWGEADLDMFKVIYEISHGMTPCDLATLCLKPCHEVFHYKQFLDASKPVGGQPSSTKNQRRTPKFKDSSPVHFTPNNPCYHTGPCNSSSQCPCFKNQSHCQRNCQCPPECNRRWQGCRCSRLKSRWSCMSERCPCVEAFRECDPELCLNCGCTTDGTSCRNSQIQRGAHKVLAVKKGNFGLGTFLLEPAKGGDLIAEYVGELIYEPTVESRADLAIHRNRCYLFGLNNTFSLDATYAGGISRFINHANADAEQSKQINSHAQVRLVNGDHRIGIFAIRDIEAGSEVLMNYGPKFFVK